MSRVCQKGGKDRGSARTIRLQSGVVGCGKPRNSGFSISDKRAIGGWAILALRPGCLRRWLSAGRRKRGDPGYRPARSIRSHRVRPGRAVGCRATGPQCSGPFLVRGLAGEAGRHHGRGRAAPEAEDWPAPGHRGVHMCGLDGAMDGRRAARIGLGCRRYVAAGANDPRNHIALEDQRPHSNGRGCDNVELATPGNAAACAPARSARGVVSCPVAAAYRASDRGWSCAGVHPVLGPMAPGRRGIAPRRTSAAPALTAVATALRHHGGTRPFQRQSRC